MHCDPARGLTSKTHHPHILHAHSHSITGRTHWVRSHKFSGGLFQAARHYKSLWPPHQHAIAKRNRVMGFPCLPNKTYVETSTCQHECHQHHRFNNHHFRWIWAMENHHSASNLKNKQFSSIDQNETFNLF